MQKLASHWTDFYEIWYISIFFKICRENASLVQILQNNGYFTRIPMSICDSILFRTTDVSDKIYSENQNRRFIYNNFFKKKVPFMK